MSRTHRAAAKMPTIIAFHCFNDITNQGRSEVETGGEAWLRVGIPDLLWFSSRFSDDPILVFQDQAPRDFDAALLRQDLVTQGHCFPLDNYGIVVFGVPTAEPSCTRYGIAG